MKKQTLLKVLSGVALCALFIWFYYNNKEISRPDPEKSIVSSKDGGLPAEKELPLEFSPGDGEVVSYRFTMTSDTKLSSDIFSAGASQGPASPNDSFVRLEVNLTGDLFLKFYHPEKKGQEFNVSGRIEGLNLTLNGSQPDYTRAMAYPFVFQMDTKGYLNDFMFTRGIPEQAQLMIKTILYAMQTVYPGKREPAWQTREIDSTGQYQADYRLTGQEDNRNLYRMEKHKQAYLLVFNENSAMAEGLTPTEVRVETSNIQTQVPARGAWIISTDNNEKSRIISGTKELGQSTTQFSAVIQDKTPVASFTDRFETSIASLNSAGWFKEKYTATDPELNAISGNVDLDATLATYLSMRASQATSDRLQAEKLMVNYLRLNPMACYDLIRLIDADPDKDRFSHEVQLELWQMITRAGHEDAQRAIVEAINNDNYSDLTHLRALSYVHDFEYPESFVADDLWKFYKSIDMVNGDDRVRELGTMTLYAIGSLGSDEKYNKDLKPEIGKSLVDTLTSTQDPQTQVTTLQAIGNYGGSEVIDQIKPFFSSESEQVRVASYEALRRMKSESAFDTFVESYNSESSPNVKTAALKILEAMPVTGKSIEWVKSEMLEVERSDDQESLAKVLGQNLGEYPESETALRLLLDKKPSNNVKKTVYRYIAPGP